MCVCVYVYIYIYICVCVYMYIYERDIDRKNSYAHFAGGFRRFYIRRVSGKYWNSYT